MSIYSGALQNMAIDIRENMDPHHQMGNAKIRDEDIINYNPNKPGKGSVLKGSIASQGKAGLGDSSRFFIKTP